MKEYDVENRYDDECVVRMAVVGCTLSEALPGGEGGRERATPKGGMLN